MPTNDFVSQNDTALGSGETDSHELQQPGAQKLSGSVTRETTAYDLDVVWQAEDGTDIETESIASNVSGGTQTTFDVVARSPRAKLQIKDSGTGAGAYDLVAHFR